MSDQTTDKLLKYFTFMVLYHFSQSILCFTYIQINCFMSTQHTYGHIGSFSFVFEIRFCKIEENGLNSGILQKCSTAPCP